MKCFKYSNYHNGLITYRACYSDGKIVPANAEPKACAGNTGTQITVRLL
jgi:hypothetical protein